MIQDINGEVVFYGVFNKQLQERNVLIYWKTHKNMNKRILTIMIFAGNVILFSACNNTTNVEKKEASLATNTTGETTSGSKTTTTSGHSHELGANSDLMQIMQNGMNEMKQMKMTGDPDYDFASMMAMHHESGIKMADEEISKGKNQELVSLAKKIKQEQETEKKEFKNYTSNNKAGSQNKAFMGEMNKHMQMAESDMNKMSMKGNIDQDFASMMAMHHKHGLMMAETEVKYGKNQKLKSMAQKSMESQKKEIKQLESVVGKKQGM